MMKSENFSFRLTENVIEFIILERDIKEVRDLYKVCLT